LRTLAPITPVAFGVTGPNLRATISTRLIFIRIGRTKALFGAGRPLAPVVPGAGIGAGTISALVAAVTAILAFVFGCADGAGPLITAGRPVEPDTISGTGPVFLAAVSAGKILTISWGTLGFVRAAWWIEAGCTFGFTCLFKTSVTAFDYTGWQSIDQSTCAGCVRKLFYTAAIAGSTMLGVNVEPSGKEVFVFFSIAVVIQIVADFVFGLLCVACGQAVCCTGPRPGTV
tara:strand:- start:991 stop:1680 length:690 start_codon:yes stop_codon:yes gene_type:complete